MIPIGAREMRLRALGMLPDDHWSPKDVRLARKAIREKAKFDRVTYNLAYPPAQRDAEALAAGGVGDVDRQTMATRNDPKPPQLAPTPAVRRKPFSEQCATCKCWFHPTQPDDGGKE
jgi:hypothetical protein